MPAAPSVGTLSIFGYGASTGADAGAEYKSFTLGFTAG